MIDEFFCEKCGRIKRRCSCSLNFDNVVFHKVFNPYNSFPTEEIDFLPKILKEILKKRGIEKLYPFQKKAMIEILNGKNVVITAPTGFGKTEAFAIPMMIKAAKGKAIVFYPTKALARDQEFKLKEYAEDLGLEVVRFDGDSDYYERRKVFSLEADIILTNPDMVDYHLRNTQAFRKFVSKVNFIAVDELHAYIGLLGANMHYLVKRLSRFSDFQIVCTSATLSNAKEFAEELFEREFVHVSGEHRKGTLNFFICYSPHIYSYVKEIVQRIRKIKGGKILIFGNSYKTVETINWVLKKSGIDSAVHKAGLPREVREKVEKDFKDGKINVIVATSTLELGIDIGDVDVVISELVPYSQFLQRVGRAGRRGQESVGILLLRDDAISTFYRNNPDEYFKDEALGFVEKKNDEVAKFHYISMCLEKVANVSDFDEEILKDLVKKGFLEIIGDKVFATEKGKALLKNFNLRGISKAVQMICEDKVVGERVLPIALKELFPGSILIHNGERYRCLKLDLKNFKAELMKIDSGDEITDPLYISVPKIISVEDFKRDPLNTYYCSLEVNLTVYGYVERNIFKDKKKIFYLEEPVSYSFRTKGIIFSCPFPDEMDYEDYYAGSFHAVEHVIIESSDTITGGGSKEMGGIATQEGDVFVYDSTEGGSGMSKLLFKKLRRAFEISYEVLKKCSCKNVEGCPKCTYSYQCGNDNRPLNKLGALSIVEKVLKGEKRETDWKKYTKITSFSYYPT